MDKIPINSYPDEVARKWKSERDQFESELTTLRKQVKILKPALEFYTSDEFPWSKDSEYDNGVTADEALAELERHAKGE